MSSSDAVRGNIRSAGHRRVTHGVFLPRPSEPEADDGALRVLGALRLVLSAESTYTGLTAARLYDWWIPSLPDWVPVFVSVPADTRGPVRPGLVVSRLRRETDQHIGHRHGLPLDEPAEVLLRCSRELGILDLVPMIDSAFAQGALTRTDIDQICSRRRAGVPRLRAATELADPRSESPWESILRVFHHTLGVPVDVQPDLYDRDGRSFGRADLQISGTRQLHEYDGGVHRSREAHVADMRRERRLVEAGYVRRGFAAGDLTHRHVATVAEIDRALGRRHRRSRVEAWRRLLDASTLSDTGRERLRNRWVRDMGVLEWWRTAG